VASQPLGLEDVPIALVGFMGSGKTTVGRLLAGRLGRGFVDTDAEVARRLGRTIPSLFAAGEERRFRAEEAAVVAEVVERRPPVVVALGGGAFEDPGSRALLLERALVVHLDVAFEDLAGALAGLAAGRPLLAGRSEAEVRALYRRRSATYALAHVRVEVCYPGVAQTLERVLAALATRPTARGPAGPA